MGVRERKANQWGNNEFNNVAITKTYLPFPLPTITINGRCMSAAYKNPKLDSYRFVILLLLLQCSGHTADLFAKDTRQSGRGQTGDHCRLGQDVHVEPSPARDVASGRATHQLGFVSAQLWLDGRSRITQLHWGPMDVRRRRGQRCLPRLWRCAALHSGEQHLLTGKLTYIDAQ